MVKRASVLLAVLFALTAVAQVKVTESQLIGKWKGKYTVDVSKAPASQKANAEQFKKSIEAASFDIELRKDHTTTTVTKGSGPGDGKLDGTWKLSGSELVMMGEKVNGQKIPQNQQRSVRFRISKVEKNMVVMTMIADRAPPTTLTMKRA